MMESIHPVKYREAVISLKVKLFNLVKKYWDFILAGFLWLCIWATYNTDIFRIFSPGFPHGVFDLIHGIRSLFPFFAIVAALIILIKNNKFNKRLFKGPLGLLLVYSIIGIIASLFSKNMLGSLYWGILYLSAIIILFAVLTGPNQSKKLSLIININWIIAAGLTLGLVLFFLIQPGVVSSLNFNSLICSQRPYEGLGNVFAEINTFGMAGTRPTGLGRYAGVIAIIALTSFFYSKKRIKIIWFFIFAIFLFFLLFTRGKTEIVAFIAAAIFIIWLSTKINIFSVLGICLVPLLFVFIVFYNIPCIDSASIIKTGGQAGSAGANSGGLSSGQLSLSQNYGTVKLIDNLGSKNIKSIITLGGRINGVWLDSWHLFLSNPLLGYGFQADRFFLNGQHAHNALLQALVQAGLSGAVPLVLAFIMVFIYLCRALAAKNIGEKEKSFLMGIAGVFVFFAVRSVTESSGAYFDADWLFLAPIIAYLQFFSRENKNSQQMNFRGNKIDLIKISDVVKKIGYWITNEPQKLHWIVATGMHGIVEAEKHQDFKYIINSADLFVPDGISLVWLARLKGFDFEKRVSGADLMQEFLKIPAEKGYKNYFYGDTEDTLKKLSEKFPNIKTDFYSPPFRELTEKEDYEIIEKINLAKPDVLWVGLGLPKQEKWIFEHREKLNVPVVIGVGAAFKFLSGKVKRAPAWVGNLGFEWLWRLFQEPKTTWKRVFIDIPIFIWLVVKDLFENN